MAENYHIAAVKGGLPDPQRTNLWLLEIGIPNGLDLSVPGQELPDTKIMLMEPFINEGSATQEEIEWFEGEVAMRSEAVQLLCAKHDVFFLSLQFDLYDLEEQHPAGYWTLDGVHPTLNFHQYMADKWVKAFEVHLNK